MHTEDEMIQIDNLVQILRLLPQQWWQPRYNVVTLETTGLSKRDLATEISLLECNRRQIKSRTWRIRWLDRSDSHTLPLDKLLANARAYSRTNDIPDQHLHLDVMTDRADDVARELQTLLDNSSTGAPVVGHSLVSWTLPTLCTFVRDALYRAGSSWPPEGLLRLSPDRQVDLALIEKASQIGCLRFRDELPEDWYERIRYTNVAGVAFSMQHLRYKYRVDIDPYPAVNGLPSPSLGKALLLHTVWERCYDIMSAQGFLPPGPSMCNHPGQGV